MVCSRPELAAGIARVQGCQVQGHGWAIDPNGPKQPIDSARSSRPQVSWIGRYRRSG
jgi:hypothetical protein